MDAQYEQDEYHHELLSRQDLASPSPTPPSTPPKSSLTNIGSDEENEVLLSFCRRNWEQDRVRDADYGDSRGPQVQKSEQQPLHMRYEVQEQDEIRRSTPKFASAQSPSSVVDIFQFRAQISKYRNHSKGPNQAVDYEESTNVQKLTHSHYKHSTAQGAGSPIGDTENGLNDTQLGSVKDDVLSVANSQSTNQRRASSPQSRPSSMDKRQPSGFKIIVSKQTFEDAKKEADRINPKKTLYVIQQKPEGYPSGRLWSVNSSLEKSLNSATFIGLTIERKNRVLKGVNANFRYVEVQNAPVEDLSDILGSLPGQIEGTAHLASGKNGTLDAISHGATPDNESHITNRELSSPSMTPPKPRSPQIPQMKTALMSHQISQSSRSGNVLKTPGTTVGTVTSLDMAAQAKAPQTMEIASSNSNQLPQQQAAFKQSSQPSRLLPQQTRIIPPVSTRTAFNGHGHPPPSKPIPNMLPLLHQNSQQRTFTASQIIPVSKKVNLAESEPRSGKTRILPPSQQGSIRKEATKQSLHTHPIPQGPQTSSKTPSVSPSRLSVVIGTSGSVSKPASQTKRLAFRVELPARTPEKILSGVPAKNIPQGASSVPKKRGRPFASKESEHRALLKASGQLVRDDGAQKKRPGRPPKARKTHTEVPSPQWKFPVFRCKFAGCAAELVNAETLRKHLHVIHGFRDDESAAGKYACFWDGCYELVDDEVDDQTEPKPTHRHDLKFKNMVRFNTFHEWRDHIETFHMESVLWTLGDGPKSQDLGATTKNRSLYEREPWLFDENGKQIRPEADLKQVYTESPKEHYTKLFKRIRIDDGWVYHSKEDLLAMLPSKKAKLLKDVETANGAQSPTWEDVPEDIGEEMDHEGPVC